MHMLYAYFILFYLLETQKQLHVQKYNLLNYYVRKHRCPGINKRTL